MKLKLDENLGSRGQAILRGCEYNVTTVLGQSLQFATDENLAEACRREGRVLVTLDLDFSNLLRFPPEDTPGIAVLRLPAEPSLELLLDLVRTLGRGLKSQSIRGKLWIVEPGRIRVHEAP